MIKKYHSAGYTLIEIAVVMVIIGLLVGGVLVGRDLVEAAAVRAQITQIERYNTAAKNFQEQYGYLPGDITATAAASGGFAARGSYPGEGDGNGILEGNPNNNSSGDSGFAQCNGENAMFWVDLSTANLIDANITSSGSYHPSATSACGGATPALYLPQAKIGAGNNYVYTYSFNGANYFGLSAANGYINPWVQIYGSNAYPGITVQEAYAIDTKVDDGLPQAGNVSAQYINMNNNGAGVSWAAGPGGWGVNDGNFTATGLGPSNAAWAYTTANCYDNAYAGGIAAVQHYQLKNATIQNCALSFKFQ